MKNLPAGSRLITVLLILSVIAAGYSAVMLRRAGASPLAAPVSQSALVGPVTVTATAGTTGPTDYTTLKDAFDAINAGTHQGAITVSISANTTETATASLNASGGTASYTSVRVQPTAVVTVTGNITGAIIKLNGADNVTIDGRIGGTGTSRDLTVSNSSTSTATAAIWLASVTAGNGASNNVIRNLELACGATQNTLTVSTFGIYMGGTTISTTATDGNDNDNNSFVANRIIRARYGIVTRGVTTNLNLNPVVADNIIGPAAFGADEIGKVGIFMQSDVGANISRNTVQFVGGDFANTTAGADRVGIALGVESWASAPGTLTSSDYTVTRNIIHDVIEERTFSAVGILSGTINGVNPTNNVIANNFIYNVKANGILGDAGVGLGIAGGNGDKVVFNSVRMSGDMDPNAGATAPTQTSVNLRIANTPTNLTVKNNSLYNDIFSSSAPALLSANIQVQSATFAFGTGGLNNNNYFFPATNTTARTGAIGTASLATTFFQTLANWQAAITPPQDQNSIQADPQYLSATDLHIALASPNVNAGATGTGITNDIDGQLRDAMPDIGADEPNGVSPPANDIAATAIITPAPGSLVSTGSTVSPQASFTNAGTAAQTNVMVQFTITGPGGYNYTDTKTIATIDPNQSVTVTFAAAPAFTTAGTYNTTASVTTPDANSTNNTVTGTFTAATPLSGSVSVGTGQSFTSLTNPGGIFDAINGLGATSNLTVNVTSDLTAETGTISLNQLAGGFTVTIQPSGGVARVISGSNATALINLNGADFIHLNGLNANGDSLTIRNTGAGATIRLINDASNNTIQNCFVEGASTTAVILLSTGTTTGNDSTIINGNTIRDRSDAAGVPVNLISSVGTSGAVANSGITINNNVLANFTSNGINIGLSNENINITGNDISQAAARTTALIGINVASALGTNLISRNTIHDLRTSFAGGTFISTAGIFVLDARDMTISRNRVFSFPAVAGGTGRLVGIEFEGATGTPAAATIVNNMVSIVTSVATAQSVFGIFDFAFGGNNTTIDYNSIYIGGTASGAASSWAINRGPTAPTNYTARNNIAFNDRTGGTGSHFAGGDQTGGGGTFVSNFNFFAGTGAGTATNFMDYSPTSGAGTPISFATWQTGPPPRDANSIAGAASTFMASNFFVNAATGDLHLKPTATPVLDMGTPLAGVTTDFDNETRSATAPDIGADELVAGAPGTLQFNMAAYSVNEAAGTATITATRTGGSTGMVSVDYATVAGGTATGGGACGGIVDYVNSTGTLTFGDGVTSQMFTVPICSDALNEANETVNLALSNVQGGATIGAQSTAVLTITDDDAAPAIAIVSPSPMPEGNSGSTPFTFNVTLSAPSGQTVTVHYSTQDNTATAPSDYTAIPDTVLTFIPGVTSLPIGVSVNGDINVEPTETFFVNLSNATNAAIGTGQGTGTIQNDDAGGQTLSVNDVRTLEGDSGTHIVQFTVTLSNASGPPPSVHYTTFNGTAIGGQDYVPIPDTILFFAPTDGAGTQTRTINVTINGDLDKEANETFYLNLFTPTNATITDDLGVCIIVDEDRAYVSDFDNDQKADLTVFRTGNVFDDGYWYTLQSTNGVTTYKHFGVNGDKAVPGDYDGDAITDVAIFRPSTGTWFILQSSNFVVRSQQWGLSTDKPVQGDYDGDAKTDIAVFRDGTWYILRSFSGTMSVVQFGSANDKAVPGDYDGDAITDVAVFRGGTWYVRQIIKQGTFVRTFNWGIATDRPVSADFDGDGKTDIAVYRDGTWYIIESLTGNSRTETWGVAGDLPVAADYDGDGTSDIAVWRPSNGNWYIDQSTLIPSLAPETLPRVNHWGQAGDVPAPFAYVPEQ